MTSTTNIDALRARVINDIIKREGGYSNHVGDLGGETMYGITQNVAREHGYRGDMRALPRDLAFSIYANEYWHKLRLDEVASISAAVAAEIADTGVNMGQGIAVRFLQTALNAMGRDGQLYPDLKVDGGLGPITLAAFGAYTTARGNDDGDAVMIAALNALQGARYIEIALEAPKQRAFTFGWFLHRVFKPALSNGDSP